VVVGDAYVRRDYQGWKPIFYGKGLHESTVGILGMGALGQAVAARLKPFGCQILYFDEQPLSPREASILGARFMYFDELMRTSDFVLIALPLNCRTKHLINRDVLSRMKHDCYLINTARGSIVDEEAVADAIGEGRLGGYAADVFEMEDLARKDRPQSISPRLLSNRARTVLTPHLGSAEHRVRRAAEAEMAHSILDYLNGRLPRGAVNRPSIKQASKAC
jgi:phosphonate dehydrogenase